MGLFSFLFGKKKKTAPEVVAKESDGQEKYLLDEAPAEEIPAPPAIEDEAAPVAAADEKDAVAKTRTVKSKAKGSNKVIRKVGGVTLDEEENTNAAKPEEADADADTEDGEVLESKTTRSGKFELKKAKDGRFFFNLYASNHTVIAFSQIYSSSSSALTGIKSVMVNAGVASTEDTTLKKPTTAQFPKWEIYIDKANQYRFRLYAANGNCVCHAAHGYTTKSGCKGGIESIIRFASEARIDKKYLTK